MRIQLAAIKPDIKEAFKIWNDATLLMKFFVLENIIIFIKCVIYVNMSYYFKYISK